MPVLPHSINIQLHDVSPVLGAPWQLQHKDVYFFNINLNLQLHVIENQIRNFGFIVDT